MRAWCAFVIAARADAGIEIKQLTQCHIQRADAATDGCGERSFYGHSIAADRLKGVLRKILIRAIQVAGFIAGIDLEPLDGFFVVVCLSNGSIQHFLGCRPYVNTCAVATDERNDRVLGHHGLAIFEADWGALCGGSELLKLSHSFLMPPRGFIPKRSL